MGRATAALQASKRSGAGSIHVDLDGVDIKPGLEAAVPELPPRVD
jgi:hypothetical protein